MVHAGNTIALAPCDQPVTRPLLYHEKTCTLKTRIRTLQTRWCTQERKEAEAAEQAAKAESIRKMEERLAMRQRQAAEEAAKQTEEAHRLAEEANKAEAEAGGEVATASPTTQTPSTHTSGTHADEAFPDAVSTEAAAAATPATTATSTADVVASVSGGDDDTQGTRDVETDSTAERDAATTSTVAETAGAVGAELPAILEETPEEPGDGGQAASGEIKDEHGDDEEGQQLQADDRAGGEAGVENIENPSNLNGVTEKQPPAAGQAGNQAARQEPEDASQNNDATALVGELALRGSRDDSGSGSDAGGGSGSSSRTRPASENAARAELAKQRKDIAILVDQAKEGMAYIKQSVDMADVLRGFVFTRHGIPVRDTAVGEELMREGRSTIRQRLCVCVCFIH